MGLLKNVAVMYGVGDGNEDEESREPRVAARPHAPTKAELAAHFPLHLHYRSWCPYCVQARATSAHHKTEGRPREGVTWSMDYCFLGENVEDDDEGERNMPIVIAHDDVKNAFWALKVPRKGPVDSVVKWCIGKMEDSGYSGTEITVKTDQE